MTPRDGARSAALVALGWALCLAAAAPVLAQEDNCRCEGSVVDDQGAPLAGATITFFMKQKNLHAQPVKTNKKGRYSHNFLAVGLYEMRAKLEGHKMVRISALTARGDGTRVTDDTYFVGSKQEVHEVSVVPQSRSDVTTKAKCVVDFIVVPADSHFAASKKLQAEKLAMEGKPLPEGASPPEGGSTPEGGAAPAAGRPAAPPSPAPARRTPIDDLRGLIEASDHAAAVPKARELVETDPANAEAHALLGEALMRTEDLPGAEQALKKALELDPARAGVNFNLGFVYVKKGRIAQAIPHFETELELNPDTTAIMENLGKAYSDTDQHAKAIATYEKLLAIDPEKVDYYGMLADAHRAAGNLAKELEVYQRMGEKDPSGDAFYTLGNLMFNKSEMVKAADAYKKALQQSPNNAQAHYQLGLAYVNLGRFKEAVTELETFVKLSPKDPKAAEARSLAAELRKLPS